MSDRVDVGVYISSEWNPVEEIWTEIGQLWSTLGGSKLYFQGEEGYDWGVYSIQPGNWYYPDGVLNPEFRIRYDDITGEGDLTTYTWEVYNKVNGQWATAPSRTGKIVAE